MGRRGAGLLIVASGQRRVGHLAGFEDEALIRAFLASPAQRRLALASQRDRRTQVRSLARHLDGRGLLAATTEDVAAWLDRTPNTSSTRTTFLVFLHAFYSWAVEEGHIASSPTVPLGRHGAASPTT